MFFHKASSIFLEVEIVIISIRGGFRGGGRLGERPLTPLQGFDPLPIQRVPLLYYFEISVFGDGPSNFSIGAVGSNIY